MKKQTSFVLYQLFVQKVNLPAISNKPRKASTLIEEDVLNQNKYLYLTRYFFKFSIKSPDNLILFVGKFLKHGLPLQTIKILNAASLALKNNLNAVSVRRSRNTTTIFDLFCKSVKMYFKVRYTALNRKIRKIVKNKYKYQKQYMWLLPRQRVSNLINLLKPIFFAQKEKRAGDRLASALMLHLQNISESPISALVKQHQKISVTQLLRNKESQSN